jgi:hypothetical protein
MDLAVDGLGLYLGKKLSDFAKPYIVKHTRQYSDAVVKSQCL